MIYYSEYLGTISYINRDQIAELLYSAEHSLCVSELRSKYIIQNRCGIPISTPLLNSCHWIYKDEDHDAFVTKLKT